MGKILTTKFYKGTRVYEQPAKDTLNGRQIERVVANGVDAKALQERKMPIVKK